MATSTEKNDTCCILIKKAQAKHVRFMYEEYLKSGSIRHVTNKLNLRGIKTARGKPFASSTVRRILSSEIYKGVLVYNRHSLQSGRKVKRKPDEHIKVTIPELAIVSEDTWNEVQKLLARGPKRPRIDDSQHLLGGLVFCSKCGYKMHGYTNRNKIKKVYKYYRCNGHVSGGSAICTGNSIRADLLESIMERELKKLSLNPHTIYEYAKEQMLEADAELKLLLDRRDELQAEINKVQNNKSKVLDLYCDDRFNKEELALKMEGLEKDRASLTNTLNEINDRVKTSNYQQIDLESVVKKITKFNDLYDKLDFQGRRELIRALVGKITIYEHEVQYEVIALPIVDGKVSAGVLEHDRMGTVALPFCHLSLKAPKPPQQKEYPLNIKTLGDHLRKRRLDLGLLQKEVGSMIGVDEATIYNWENNRASPSLHALPRVIRFLGYNPNEDKPQTVGEKLRAYRKARGITQSQLARRLGVDPSTLARWEKGKSRPMVNNLQVIKQLFKSSS